MRARYPDKTAGDYLALAVAPILIMLMIGSFTFFLLELFYRGEHIVRLRWTLFWFVLASVLVCRIGVEEGRAKAGVYGMGLAWATAMMIFRFVDFVWGVLVLLAFIWWCASRLVRDCTVIEDDTESAGQGLLAAGGFEGRMPAAAAARSPQADLAVPAAVRRRQLKGSRRPHAPGLWVLYFSLLALPVFGFGEAALRSATEHSRRLAFAFASVYVAAAIGLLMTTSFLGLRRYLRQRYLQMPASVARRWIHTGILLGACVMLVGALLPRPNANYSLSALAGRIGAPAPTAPEGRARASESEHASQRPAPAGRSNGLKPDPSRSAPAQSAAPGERTGNQTPGQAIQRPSALGALSRWIVYAVLALAGLWLLMRYRNDLWRGWTGLWAGLIALFRRVGRFGRPSRIAPLTSRKTKIHPFSRFSNPFASGAEHESTPEELIRYTFEAMRAWAAGPAPAPATAQTPWEFASDLAARHPDMAEPALGVARSYIGLAYGGKTPEAAAIENARQMWRAMDTAGAPMRATPGFS